MAVWHGVPEQEALTIVAAHRQKGRGVAGILDSDCDRDLSEIVRDIDHRLAHRGVYGVGAAIRNECAIELDLSERQLFKLRQRRVSFAEIVDGDFDIERRKLLGQFSG